MLVMLVTLVTLVTLVMHRATAFRADANFVGSAGFRLGAP